MNIFLQRLISYSEKQKLIVPGDRIIAGVSGGADSVALLLALHRLRESMGIPSDGIIAVHINHMIRDNEAFEDENFVRELCAKEGIACRVFSKDITSYAKDLGMTIEEAGRKFRYENFSSVLAETGFNKIAVAHNMNDTAETVLFNMARGTGLKGLAGIPAKRDNIIRPLLFAKRQEIEDYLKSINQDYRTDSTNLSVDYDRNKIRHIVLPALMDINERAIDHICRLAEEAGLSYESIRENAVRKASVDAADASGNIVVSVSKLRELDSLEAYYVIHDAISRVAGKSKDITRRHVEAVYSLISQETGKKLELPYGITARLNYDDIIIGTEKKKNKDFNITIDGEGEYIIPDNGILKIQVLNPQLIGSLVKNDYTKIVDYDKIKGKLCVRTPQKGDYLKINKTGNSKKLSRIFIDMKIDRDKREGWPVVAVDDEVIWAVGLRYNEAYRVDDTTNNVLFIEYIGKGEQNG